MTTAQTPVGEPQLKPLWTDEMIRYEVEGWQLNCIESEIPVVQDLMKKMRGPYEHDRRRSHQRTQALEARIRELMQQLGEANRQALVYKESAEHYAKLNVENDLRALTKNLRVERNYATALEKVIDMLEEDEHDE